MGQRLGGVHAANIQDLWRIMGLATFGLGSRTRVVWRGLPDSSFKVVSTLVRALETEGVDVTEENLRQREVEILQVARDWDIGLSEHGSVTDLHLLAMLQHHGAPTRLIDVTYNPLTALWFACSDAEKMDVPGVLVVLTVSDALKRSSSQVPALTYDTLTTPGAATIISALRESRKTGGSLLIEPRPKDERMKAQEGAFLTGIIPEVQQDGPVVGLTYSPFAPMLPAALDGMVRDRAEVEGAEWQGLSFAGIVVSPQLKRELLPILDHTFNRSHRTMYPDMPGFVSALQKGVLKDQLFELMADMQDFPGEMPEYWRE